MLSSGDGSRGDLVVLPGDVLVVDGAGLEAAVQDADKSVRELPQGCVMGDVPGAERVVVGPCIRGCAERPGGRQCPARPRQVSRPPRSNRSAVCLRLRAVGVALTRARRSWGFLQVGRRGPSHMTSTIPAAKRPGGVAAQAGDLPTYRQSVERTAPAGPRSASTPQAIHRRRKSTRTRTLSRALSS